MFTGFKDQDKTTAAQPRFYIEALYRFRKHAGKVCITFKSMLIETEITTVFPRIKASSE